MKRYRIAFLFLILAFSISSSAFAEQQDPLVIKEKVNANVKTASQMITQADTLLAGQPTTEQMKQAMALYVQAGQAFQMAGQIYQKLMPTYASEQDVTQSAAATQRCFTSAKRLQAMLQQKI